MHSTRIAVILALAVAVLGGATSWYAAQNGLLPSLGTANAANGHSHGSAPERSILYYRDPSGAPNWSAQPRKDAAGRDFLPVYDDEEPSFDLAKKASAQSAHGDRKI